MLLYKFKIVSMSISHKVSQTYTLCRIGLNVALLTSSRESFCVYGLSSALAGWCGGEATLGSSQSTRLLKIAHPHSAALTPSPGRQRLEHHAMDFDATRDSSSGRHLPTRVSNACDRCRRNKSRCDPFRPCSLCTRANVECLAGNNEDQPRPAKRRRTREPLRDEHLNPEPPAPTTSGPHSQPPPAPAPGHDRSEPILLSAGEIDQNAESRRPSVGDGPVESAVGIAHKVSCRSQRLRRIKFDP
jgi:hypothetical protein